MSIAGIISLKSLQWSYQNGKISQKQVEAYVIVIGVEENLVIGQREFYSRFLHILRGNSNQ